jgi:DNA-binding NtrC family response regulator
MSPESGIRNKEPKILIIDDDHGVLISARMFLEQLCFDVTVLSDPEKLIPQLEKEDYDIIMLDMNFQKGSTEGLEGLKWLSVIKEKDPNSVVILMTAFGDVDLAVKGIRSGAFDFILKPWGNSKLHASVLSALKMRDSYREKEKFKNRVRVLESDSDLEFMQILGESEPIKKLKEVIKIVAPTDANVLILGENGTGKELVARAVHRYSRRKDDAIIGVDMGAIPETLFESELFGHEKGAFTGAVAEKPGRFELASGGSLFLDEIGNIPVTLQTKLLTVLERRKINRIGSQLDIPIDIRLISATNQPIAGMVENGEFRRDLLYRLNTIELHLPSLRERSEDIPLLANHFLQESCRKYGKSEMDINRRGIKQLQSYHWPGNVRELQNVIARAVILSENKSLRFDQIGSSESKMDASYTLNLEENEKSIIQRALTINRANVTRASADLGIDRNALYRRMKKYGIQ